MPTRSLPLWVLAAALWVLRVVTAAMLAVDAYIHADLAYRYDPNRAASISQGTLFRWKAGTLGPLPNMYEPFWYGEKTRAAVAEGIATGTAFLGLVLATWTVWAHRRAKRAAEPAPIAGGRGTPVRARIRHDY